MQVECFIDDPHFLIEISNDVNETAQHDREKASTYQHQK